MINFINISDAKAVICDEKYLKSILDNREKLKNNVLFINIDSSSNIEDSLKFNKLLDDGAKKIATGNTAFKDIKINPNDMHVLLFTSGTVQEMQKVFAYLTRIFVQILCLLLK